MRRRVLTYLWVLLLVCGCFDDSYRGSVDDPYINPQDRVPVVVQVGDPEEYEGLQNVGMKGSGPVNGMSDWDGREIYVYAFNKYLHTDFSLTRAVNDVSCLIDGSVDNPGSLAGKKAIVSEDGRIAEWVGPENSVWYPSGEHSTQLYDFFAYYLAGARPEQVEYIRASDFVRVNMEIDGSQDLMSAKAELTRDQLERFDSGERTRVEEYAYSYYTGSRNVLPRFYFTHHLAKIDFEIMPGYVENATKFISAESVTVESKYKATFTVADKNSPSKTGVSFRADRKELHLTEPDGSPLTSRKYGVETLSSTAMKGEPVHVGGSLLVAPGDSEMMARIALKEVRRDGKEENTVHDVEISYDRGFEAGNRYVVRLTLYGALNIEVNVEMTEWEEGGDIFIDTEEKPE